MTIKFFGDWGSKEIEHIDRPLGAICLFCDDPIRELDDGAELDHVDEQGWTHRRAAHRHCLVDSVSGPQCVEWSFEGVPTSIELGSHDERRPFRNLGVVRFQPVGRGFTRGRELALPIDNEQYRMLTELLFPRADPDKPGGIQPPRRFKLRIVLEELDA